MAWFILVFPALALNYLGQGAFVLANPQAIENPFYLMYPKWALLPVVILATMATIIASQAVITGAFSLARQAVHLGFLPRLAIKFTSETNTGQIYVPAVNLLLFIGVIVLIFSFGDSESLATAYGISVTGAMVVTTLMSFQFLRSIWGWSTVKAAAVLLPLLVLEAVFLGANLLKIHDGGWVPVALALAIMAIMWTWTRGSHILREKTAKNDMPLDIFIKSIERPSEHAPVTVPGTAVFLTSVPDRTPAVLLHNIKHNHVLHEQNVILTIWTQDKPHVPDSQRVDITQLPSASCASISISASWTNRTSPAPSSSARKRVSSSRSCRPRSTLAAATSSARQTLDLPVWQERLYIALADFGIDPSAYFKLPANRVVELGEQVAI